MYLYVALHMLPVWIRLMNFFLRPMIAPGGLIGSQSRVQFYLVFFLNKQISIYLFFQIFSKPVTLGFRFFTKLGTPSLHKVWWAWHNVTDFYSRIAAYITRYAKQFIMHRKAKMSSPRLFLHTVWILNKYYINKP